MVIMVRVESFMFNIVIAILSSFPFLFIASVSFTVAGINFVSKFVDNIKPDFWYKLAFGSLNGIIAIVAETFITSNAPYIIMIFVPLVTVLEIMSISRGLAGVHRKGIGTVANPPAIPSAFSVCCVSS